MTTWLKQNISALVVPLAIVIGSGLVSWGVIKATQARTEKDIAALQIQIHELNLKVDAHHTDPEKHLDKRLYDLLLERFEAIQTQINETNSLLRVHMRRTGS